MARALAEDVGPLPRVSGKGPVFHRFGSWVSYLLADIEE